MGGSIDNISVSKNRKEIISLRTLAINNLINKCIEQFKENYSNIMDGLFSNDLISMIPGVEGKGIINARNLSKDKIWTNRRKIELEIGSHSCISTIMCSFIKAVSEYKYDSNCMSFSSKHLVKMMAESAPTSEDSHYQCYMKVNDFVSGMTDNYATYIAKQIAGMAQ